MEMEIEIEDDHKEDVLDEKDVEIIGVELEFETKYKKFCEMLPSPEGVTCGGETIMYYKDDDGREYFYLATMMMMRM